MASRFRILILPIKQSLGLFRKVSSVNTSQTQGISSVLQSFRLRSSEAMAHKIATFEQVKALKDDQSYLLIDVREPSELKETGILPGSINIPLADLENVLKTLPGEEFKNRYGRPKPGSDFPLVFSCRMGGRSAKAVEIAAQLGYTNLANYAGGWTDWEKQIKK